MCHNKANVRAAFEKFCTKHNEGKYKCSKSWKCKNIGCMGCIKHECIVEGITKEIKQDDILMIQDNGILLVQYNKNYKKHMSIDF